MYALILIFAMLVGETENADGRTCFYLYNGKTYTQVVLVEEACPVTIQVSK
jgi:hypothetical protein